MAKKLQAGINVFLKGVFVVLVFFFLKESASGQIQLRGGEATEISFSVSERISTGNSVQINLYDLNSFNSSISLGGNYPLITSPAQVRPGNDSYYTAEYFNEMASLGFQPTQESEGIFATFTMQNVSDHSLGDLTLAFDWLIYENQSPQFKLLYRVNHGRWKETRQGYFSLPSGSNVDQLVPVSLQFSLDEIYLKNNDTIEIRWDWKTDDQDIFFALQRIEAHPGIIKKNEKLHPGSLIITEILPGAETSHGYFEYFEVYNATNNEISMKGVEIWVGNNHEVIQKDIVIEPHEFAVFSKTETDYNVFRSDYNYESISLMKTGGSLKLRYKDVDISRATYNGTTGNSSWELTSASQAFDGYSSMQDFTLSGYSINSELKGSPGEAGSTIRLYTKYIENNGWHLISIPGLLEPELNRNVPEKKLSYVHNQDDDFSWNEISLYNLLPGQPALIKIESAEETIKKLMALELPLAESFRINRKKLQQIVVAGNPFINPITLNQILNPQHNSVTGVAQIWDPEDKTYQLINTNQSSIPAWSGFVIPANDEEYIQIRSEKSDKILPEGLLIQFDFTVITRSDDRYYDRATAIKFYRGEQDNGNFYNMKKLWPVRTDEFEIYKSGIIYLTGQHGKQPMAQMSVSLKEMPETHFYLTPLASGLNGSATLNWSVDDLIPNEWEILLTDLITGEITDMRSKDLYQFEVIESLVHTELLPAETGIIPLPLMDQEPRLKVTINPDPAARNLSDEAENEIPDVIALNQNYPNPFNPATNISFFLPEPKAVKIGIYNVVGQRVELLLENIMQAGDHTI
ncbi:MAG: lamin tail domain-containing protein, partial [Balneolaceae bacterium]